MIDQVFDAIAKFGPYIHNTIFLNGFVERFATDYIDSNKYVLKLIKDYNNPLYRIMELRRRQSQMSNDLLLHLIARCSIEIRPDDDELLQHSFVKPTRDTCTYTILFDDCFAQLTIRHETLDRLAAIWSMWEGQRLTYAQVWTKKLYNTHQELCFNDIWDAVGKHSGKQYQIGILFDTAHKNMMETTRIKEKIITCLNDYCDRVIDKQTYEDLLGAMQQQMESSVIHEIQVPPVLKQLVPFVEQLNPFSRADAWLQFYNNYIHEQGKNINLHL